MIRGLGRRRIQRQIEDLNTNDRVVLWVPAYSDCPACGYDEKSRAGKDISCSTCNGSGRTVSWYTATIVHKELLEDMRDSEDAYIEIDTRRLRVMSVDFNRVEGKTTVVIRCEMIRNG